MALVPHPPIDTKSASAPEKQLESCRKIIFCVHASMLVHDCYSCFCYFCMHVFSMMINSPAGSRTPLEEKSALRGSCLQKHSDGERLFFHVRGLGPGETHDSFVVPREVVKS